jgi:hypothetical protein
MKEFVRVGSGMDRWMNAVWLAGSYDWGKREILTSFVFI